MTCIINKTFFILFLKNGTWVLVTQETVNVPLLIIKGTWCHHLQEKFNIFVWQKMGLDEEKETVKISESVKSALEAR